MSADQVSDGGYGFLLLSGRHQGRRTLTAQQRVPANRIAEAERTEIIEIVNALEFVHMGPNQIVRAPAGQGRYIASVLIDNSSEKRSTWDAACANRAQQ